MSSIVTFVPGWLIALLLFALLWLASWLGMRLRQRLRINAEMPYATSAAISLLALLIGFTFSMALSRYESRRDLLVEEAAALESMWQRVPLIADPARSELVALTRSYADQRLAYFSFGIDLDTATRADKAADDIAEHMWMIVRDLSAANDQPLITRMLMDNLTRIDDAAWRREAMGREHIPALVIDLLVIFALCTAVSMGFAAPPGDRVHPPHLIFYALTAAAIMLMLDIDHPRSGLIIISQRPMNEVIAIMADAAPAPTAK